MSASGQWTGPDGFKLLSCVVFVSQRSPVLVLAGGSSKKEQRAQTEVRTEKSSRPGSADPVRCSPSSARLVLVRLRTTSLPVVPSTESGVIQATPRVPLSPAWSESGVSSVSLKSDHSKAEPPCFSPQPGPASRSESGVSSVSLKSDHSKAEPPCFSPQPGPASR
ncbi:hypothetical protein WMY93_033545, partial [Mugilogobius chulae]